MSASVITSPSREFQSRPLYLVTLPGPGPLPALLGVGANVGALFSCREMSLSFWRVPVPKQGDGSTPWQAHGAILTTDEQGMGRQMAHPPRAAACEVLWEGCTDRRNYPCLGFPYVG